MSPNQQLKELYRARVMRRSEELVDDRSKMWMERILNFFDIILEVAESTLPEGHLLSEAHVINSAKFENLLEFINRIGRPSGPLFDYFTNLPGFRWDERVSITTEREHFFTLVALQRFLVIEHD